MLLCIESAPNSSSFLLLLPFVLFGSKALLVPFTVFTWRPRTAAAWRRGKGLITQREHRRSMLSSAASIVSISLVLLDSAAAFVQQLLLQLLSFKPQLLPRTILSKLVHQGVA